MKAILRFNHSTPIRRLAKGLVIFVAIAVVCLAASAWNSSAVAGEPGYDHPCIVIWHSPNYPPPGKPMVCGLELAIWKDGTILMAAGERVNPGQDILVGNVDPKDIDAALKQIRDADFFDGLTAPAIIDAGSTLIHVDGAGKSATVRYLGLFVPKGNMSEDSHRKLLRKWRRTRGAIEAISPIELSKLEEKMGKEPSFRGYNPSQPATTPWRPF